MGQKMGQTGKETNMARRGENIRKRKDGRWEGRFPKNNDEGKKIQGSVFGKTYHETKEKLIKAKVAESEKRMNLKAQSAKAMDDLFFMTAGNWFETTIPTLKPASIARYRNILDCYILPEFGEKRTVDISREEVLSFLNRLLTSGGSRKKALAPKTVASILSIMKNIMQYARNVKCVPVISFDGIAVKQSQRQLRVFSKDEQQTICDYLLNEITPIKLGILLVLYTGLRVGEICALTWGDISFLEKCIHVGKTMQRIQLPKGDGQKTKIIIDTPKSDCSIRDIPIPEKIFHIIIQERMPDNCFFLTGQEKVFIEPRTLQNHFNAIMRSCGIKNATMHTCRHSFATRCVELGFDIKSLSEILGHASVAITMNRYVHPSMDLKKWNMDKLSDLLVVR